jgi:hypothetical protein
MVKGYVMKKDLQPVKIRVNIAGFHGSATSLFCAFDPDNDILLIVSEAEQYESTRREGFLHITNQDRDETIDATFNNDEVKDAIVAYFEAESLKLLAYGAKATRCNPASKIERDGIDVNGPRYRIAPDMSNGQVAVLVACRYAALQRHVGSAQEMMDELISMTTI